MSHEQRKFLCILLCTGIACSAAGAAYGAEGRPCVANFNMQGSFMAGRTIRVFQEFPSSVKTPAFGYVVKKLGSIGYKINSFDKELGMVSASYGVGHGLGTTLDMNVSLEDRKPTGVRVEIVFTAPGGVAFDKDEAQREFCSILEGVPQ